MKTKVNHYANEAWTKCNRYIVCRQCVPTTPKLNSIQSMAESSNDSCKSSSNSFQIQYCAILTLAYDLWSMIDKLKACTMYMTWKFSRIFLLLLLLRANVILRHWAYRCISTVFQRHLKSKYDSTFKRIEFNGEIEINFTCYMCVTTCVYALYSVYTHHEYEQWSSMEFVQLHACCDGQ